MNECNEIVIVKNSDSSLIVKKIFIKNHLVFTKLQ